MMNWPQLLSLQKYGDLNPRPRAGQDELRLGFEVDYDRIVFSQHFRSLQDKTQVIPLSQTGFVHTRLTHSLEVSSVARSLGRMAGIQILQQHPELIKLGYRHQDFGAITAAAALAHDIGNPPFGHSGEKSIGAYFTTVQGSSYLNTLSRKQKQDLLQYEGNAHGYHLLNRHRPGTPGGLRLSYATLGAFVKYPKPSLPKKPTPHVAHKKFGVFQADSDHFDQVATTLGMQTGIAETPYHRHPLAYLVEAADDICYTIIDFEDGINLGWISEDYALELLIKLVGSTIKTDTYSQLATTQERLAYLRSLAIGSLIKDVVSTFVRHEDKILSGTMTRALMDISSYKTQIDDILKITIEKVYRHEEVLQKEISGYRVIQCVLDAIIKSRMAPIDGTAGHLNHLIANYTSLENSSTHDVYSILLDSCNYVAMLSDSQVIALFKIINGQM